MQERLVKDLASTCDLSLFDSSKISGIRVPWPGSKYRVEETDHDSKTFAIRMKNSRATHFNGPREFSGAVCGQLTQMRRNGFWNAGKCFRMNGTPTVGV